jgi:hypothetical protein
VARRIKFTKNSDETNRNQTRYLSVRGAVSQLNAPPHAPKQSLLLNTFQTEGMKETKLMALLLV